MKFRIQEGMTAAEARAIHTRVGGQKVPAGIPDHAVYVVDKSRLGEKRWGGVYVGSWDWPGNEPCP